MEVFFLILTNVFLTVFLLGLRHGIDWDHIVAISDITATTMTTSIL